MICGAKVFAVKMPKTNNNNKTNKKKQEMKFLSLDFSILTMENLELLPMYSSEWRKKWIFLRTMSNETMI